MDQLLKLQAAMRVFKSRAEGRTFSSQVLWNQFPVQSWESDTVSVSKTRLKTLQLYKVHNEGEHKYSAVIDSDC